MGLRLFNPHDDEEDQFFDAREEISSSFDSTTNHRTITPLFLSDDLINWVHKPHSIHDRRNNLMRWMGLDSIQNNGDCIAIDRMTCEDGAVLGFCDSEEPYSTLSGWSTDRWASSVSECSEDNNLEYGTTSFDESREDNSSSPSSNSNRSSMKKNRLEWLKRLGFMACMVYHKTNKINQDVYDSGCFLDDKLKKVRVCNSNTKCKKFSALYAMQDIKAHDGGILTMKFSPDGKYLATGGEDGVVRVWLVMECERVDEGDFVDGESSCEYFRVNHNCEFSHLKTSRKEKKGKRQSMKRNSDSACVVLPPNMFHLSESPLHEFFGHVGDVLDISWSENKQLLSSSVDKTARLWKVGSENCLQVFRHSDYVTSVQFNPIDENYFISGSIDGKVRIWDVSRRRVVNWADAKEIITTVCYRPNGLGGVVGTITGDCRFYNVSENQLQLDAVVSLQGRKKSPEKRITGFQFCPNEPHKLMVTSADSTIRILNGVEVISKYKGLQNSGSQISASFTADGKHIISASEDSHVYVWTHNNHIASPSCRQSNAASRSCERFFSSNISVAIPWLRTELQKQVLSEAFVKQLPSVAAANEAGVEDNNLFSQFLSKGSSATWPEENLPPSSSFEAISCKSQFQLLKTFRNTPYAWGQVIVAAGWDGRIRSYHNYGLPVHQ